MRTADGGGGTVEHVVLVCIILGCAGTFITRAESLHTALAQTACWVPHRLGRERCREQKNPDQARPEVPRAPATTPPSEQDGAFRELALHRYAGSHGIDHAWDRLLIRVNDAASESAAKPIPTTRGRLPQLELETWQGLPGVAADWIAEWLELNGLGETTTADEAAPREESLTTPPRRVSGLSDKVERILVGLSAEAMTPGLTFESFQSAAAELLAQTWPSSGLTDEKQVRRVFTTLLRSKQEARIRTPARTWAFWSLTTIRIACGLPLHARRWPESGTGYLAQR